MTERNPIVSQGEPPETAAEPPETAQESPQEMETAENTPEPEGPETADTEPELVPYVGRIDPEVAGALLDAAESGKWMLAVWRVEQGKDGAPNRLHYWRKTHGLPDGDRQAAVQHLKDDLGVV